MGKITSSGTESPLCIPLEQTSTFIFIQWDVFRTHRGRGKYLSAIFFSFSTCLNFLNSIFSSTYGPSTSTPIRLYKSYIRSLFDYGAPAICVASPDMQLILERIQTHFISRALSIPSFIHNDKKRQHAYLPPIHDRTLYLAKRWYKARDATQPRSTGLHRQSHSQQTQQSRRPHYTTWTDQELIFK